MKILLEVFYMSQELRTQLCNVVKVWKDLKVQYEHRGTTRNGCDCTGLIIGALRELGYLKNYKLRSYPLDWNLHAKADNYIVEELIKYSHQVTKPDIGDLVLFSFGRCVAHAGVMIENNLFVHCYLTSKRCTISSLKNSPWTKRISGFYRLEEDKLNELG